MSAPEPRPRAGEAVAGYLAAASIAVSLIGIAYRPVRTIPAAVVVALVAVVMGGRHQRLGTVAVLVGAASFVVGMSVAVATRSSLW